VDYVKEIKSPHTAYKVVATVKSVHGLKGEETGGKGPCQYYRPGDQIVFDKSEIKGTICYGAVASMMYKICALRLGFDYPWHKKGLADHLCPDPQRPVVFELRRIEEDSTEPP
jgi:uncharacterized repeat protein (TIGR04076 family)